MPHDRIIIDPAQRGGDKGNAKKSGDEGRDGEERDGDREEEGT